MRLKKPNETPGNGGFVFYFVSEQTGKEVEVKGGNSVSQLTNRYVIPAMRNNGMEPPENLEEIVEHQICVRQNFPAEECYMGGIGDTLHQKWVKPFLQATEKRAKTLGRIGRAIAKVVGKIGKCGGCGGTKVYREGQNALGRAGTLNKLSGNREFEKLKTR